jgi:cytochrome b6-f complex iron-sulfur subunit
VLRGDRALNRDNTATQQHSNPATRPQAVETSPRKTHGAEMRFAVTESVDSLSVFTDSSAHRSDSEKPSMSEQITPYQVAPKTPLAGSAAADIREQGEMTRRSFPVALTTAWVALAAAVGGLTTIFVRYLFPNVLFEPVQKFKAGLPGDYSVGEVDERWKDKFGIWIVRTEDMMYALDTTCTHLGCTPNWLPSQNKFKCPCHGSGYYRTGINFEGPAPRPLERAKIAIDPADGQILIDKSQKFHGERGEWTNPESFLKL